MGVRTQNLYRFVVVPKSIDPETFVEVCTQLLELPRLQ